MGFISVGFTPIAEVDLCGHATLASAHVIFEILGYTKEVIEFETRSGRLGVLPELCSSLDSLSVQLL
jgi:predicted PhzF superfamily epimerase YddE/YHI9